MRKITQMIGRQKVALVFTNQLRQKLGVMFGDPWTTSGGKALPFHASTRIRLNVLKEHKLVKSGGAWYTLVDQNGEEHKFQSKDWEELITSDEELREYVYKIICDKVILKYKEKLGIDDVEFTDEVIGD